jgi:O-antigen/teichoic acid export membrane protein
LILTAEYLKKLTTHTLARGASWILAGQGANFFLQAVYFLLLARLLGATEYGIFAGTFALVNLVTPYSAFGSTMLFMRYVCLDRSQANIYWGNALLITVVMTALIVCLFVFIGPVLTNIHRGGLFAALVVANCLFGQIPVLASGVFQTFDKMHVTAALRLLSNLARVLTVVLAKIILVHATAFQWALGVLIASFCAAAISMLWVRSEIGQLKIDVSLIFRRTREGLGFAFAGSTQTVYNEVDKIMLSHYGLNKENGFYTLAYRIVDFATAPMWAIEAVIMPRMFRLGQKSTTNVVQLAVKAGATSAVLGVLIAVVLLLTAPIIPHLVGRDFAQVIAALRWLCLIPLWRGIHQVAGSALTSTGHQNLWTIAQVTVAGANFLLNLWWIPLHGWIGAAWASIASDGLLAVLNSLLLLWLWRKISTCSVVNVRTVTDA